MSVRQGSLRIRTTRQAGGSYSEDRELAEGLCSMRR